MKMIDKGRDTILDVDYELYSIKLSELTELAKSWYPDIDFKEFDDRKAKYIGEEETLKIIKKVGIITNYFFAYKEGEQYYLLDGFNRILTDYGKIKSDPEVYLKVITTKLQDNELMLIMFNLNLKLSSRRYYEAIDPIDFFDRGFRLLLFKKFGIRFYSYEDANTKKRNDSDFELLEEYFKDEKDYSMEFSFDYEELHKIFGNRQVINDLKEIVKYNDYLTMPFENYNDFFSGFVRFLSRRRLRGDENRYEFKDFLEMLYKDKFFKKLQKMSWTDSCRKNVYKFFQKIEEEIEKNHAESKRGENK